MSSLLDHMVLTMERAGRSPRTIAAYCSAVRRIWFWARRVAPGIRSLRDMTDANLVAIFDHLRRDDRLAPVSISMHLCAYKWAVVHVYGRDLGQVEGLRLPRRADNVRVLPHAAEVTAIFRHLRGVPRVVLGLIVGTGMRIEETCKLRVHQVDLIGGLLMIRRGKGQKDRFVRVAPSLLEPLTRYLAWRRAQWDADLALGFGAVTLPGAYGRKCRGAERQWEWQWLFPSTKRHENMEAARWHISPGTVQRAMKEARRAAGIARILTPHHLRHYHAAALKSAGVDTVDIQTILGHQDIATTKLYIHADNVLAMDLPDVFAMLPAS